MSAVWVKLAAVLCVCFTALAVVERSEVQWRNLGGSVTIQCDCSVSNQDFMDLKKGLNRDTQVLFIDNKGQKVTIATEFKGRLQTNGLFPKVEILIQNLTFNDIGPYWCTYKRIYNGDPIITDGAGSVLLVVKEKNIPEKEDPNRTCDPSKENLILVSVVVSAVLILCIILGFLIWFFKTKATVTTVKSRRIPSNDVYEDMRGTLRR